MENNKIQILTEDKIKNMVYEIRGQQVMLDFELAEIYGYETKNFNRQVKRNIEKFDNDFLFQLTEEEWNNLRCQNVTSSWGGTRYLPYAFTEQGIYMLMTVLKGELAIKQSKALIRMFKRMKEYILENSFLINHRELARLSLNIEKLNEDNIKINNKISTLATKDELNKVMENFIDESKLKHFLIMDGEKIEADMAYTNIYKIAKNSLYIVDNYISLKTLELLRNINDNVEVILFSDNLHHNNKLTKNIFNDFKNEYNNINIKLKLTNGRYHDRYIIIDFRKENEMIYHCGSSSKDSGNKITTITKVEDLTIYNKMIDELLKNKDLVL